MNRLKIRVSAIILMVAILAITVTSCQKEEQIFEAQGNESVLDKPLVGVENCSATIKNGFIAFKSVEDINAYYKYLETHSEEDIDNMEKQNAFMSYNRKIENILREYEVLNEDRNTTMEDILAFREKYKQYITITDEDFFPNIEGLSDRLINPAGYMQVGEAVSKYVNQNIYTTGVENFNLLENNSFSSELISKSEVKVIEMEPSSTDRVNAMNSPGNHTAYLYDKRKCRRWHKTTASVKAYSFANLSGYYYHFVTCQFGYRYQLKNMKRGWTGIWYGQSRYSRNQGNYTGSNGTGSFNDANHSVNVSRSYNVKYLWAPYTTPSDAANWYNDMFIAYAHGYIEGTVFYDVCGSRTWNY